MEGKRGNLLEVYMRQAGIAYPRSTLWYGRRGSPYAL